MTAVDTPSPAGAPATKPPPDAVTPVATDDIAAPKQSSPAERLKALAPLTDNLAKSVTCPICLEYMENARQLQCGHLFCAECVVRMLGMPKVRCAMCKEKTGKRMVRTAPLPFAEIVKNLRILESIVEEHKAQIEGDKPVALNDGFSAVINTTLERIQRAQQARENAARNPQSGGEKEITPAPARRTCVLCPKRIDPVSFGNNVYFGKLTSVSTQTKKRALFAHEACALYSKDVYEMEGVFENVERLLARTKKYSCSREACGRTNPNVCCAFEGCKEQYHFPCAVVEGCAMVEDGYKMFCVSHKHHAPKIGEDDFKRNLTDPNDKENLEHENECFQCQTGGRLLMCDGCSRVTHPACSGLKSIPIGDWYCGVCTGTHILKRKRIESEAGIENRGGNQGSSTKRPRKAGEAGRRFVIIHTGLQESQRDLLYSIAKTKKVVLKDDVEPRVTHLVISTYSVSEIPRRTMKLCKAIASKIPIVCWKWVEDSATVKDWVSFENYVHPLTWKKDEASVFQDKVFYFGCYNGDKKKKDDLITLVQLGNGAILQRDPTLVSLSVRQALLYVREEENRKGGRREFLSRFEPPSNAKIVSSGWILDKCTKDRGI